MPFRCPTPGEIIHAVILLVSVGVPYGFCVLMGTSLWAWAAGLVLLGIHVYRVAPVKIAEIDELLSSIQRDR